MKVLYLRWLDSALSTGLQYAPGGDGGLSEIESVGYLLHEDKRHIQIAQSTSRENESYDAILAIPKSAILERRVIELPKRRVG